MFTAKADLNRELSQIEKEKSKIEKNKSEVFHMKNQKLLPLLFLLFEGIIIIVVG